MQKSAFISFVREENGATSIEYALIGSLVSIFIIGGVAVLGESMTNLFEIIRSAFDQAI